MNVAHPVGLPDRASHVAALLAEFGAWGGAERRQAFESWLRRSISLTHLLVLAILDTRGPVRVSELARVLDVSVPSTTGIVSRLEQRGLVMRVRGAMPDLRIVRVEIAGEGRRILDELEIQQRGYLASLLDEVADEDLPALLEAARILGTARARLLVSERVAVSGQPR